MSTDDDSPDGATMPRVSVEALLEGFAAVGLEADAIREAAGIDPCDEDRVPSAWWGRLWEAAQRMSPEDEALPTRVGLAVPFGTFGLLDYLASTAPTLDEAFRILASYMDAASSRVTCVYAPPELELRASGDAPEWTEEFLVAVFTGRFRALGGRPAVVRAAHLRRPAPSRRSHERLLSVAVRFGAARTLLELDPGALAAPNGSADPHLHRSLRGTAERLGHGLAASTLEARVRALLPGLIEAGRADAPSLAKLLGVSRRTLFRQLRAEGMSLRGLIDERRAAEAARRLRAGEAVAEVASAVGYADQAAFTRAFVRWFGQPPARWRARLG